MRGPRTDFQDKVSHEIGVLCDEVAIAPVALVVDGVLVAPGRGAPRRGLIGWIEGQGANKEAAHSRRKGGSRGAGAEAEERERERKKKGALVHTPAKPNSKSGHPRTTTARVQGESYCLIQVAFRTPGDSVIVSVHNSLDVSRRISVASLLKDKRNVWRQAIAALSSTAVVHDRLSLVLATRNEKSSVA